MKIKLDENMPAGLAIILRDLGHDADTIPEEGLAGSHDLRVWHSAQEEGRFFVTQDLDFSDVSQFQPGAHYGLLLVRLSNPGRKALTWMVKNLFETEDVESWQSCFVVVTERKIRIKRPA